MAKKEILVDDIDGTDADETVEFAVDGVEYSIDLSSANAQTLRDAIKPYTDKATPKRGRRTSTAAVRGSSEDLAAIREWALANGHEVAPRGRVAESVKAAYKEANK